MEIIDIFDAPRPVRGAQGIIYSTNPQVAITEKGKCFLKNHNPEIVFAEAVCYALANAANLDVPRCFFCREGPNGRLLFGSAEKKCRFPVDVLIRRGLICNPHVLSQTIVFDTWVCNIDRNVGNYVAELTEGASGKFRLFAIDFEKSEVCRGKGSLVLAGVSPRKCWPTESLGQLCRPLTIPREFCNAIQSIGDTALEDIVNGLSIELSWRPTEYLENCIYNLKERKQKLIDLVREAWSV